MSKRKLSNTTQSLFDSFIQECRLYQKSESTISNYEISFNVLCKHFDGIEKRPIGSIDKSLIVEFTKRLSDTSLSVASINHYLRDIRAFLYWCMEDEYIPPFKVKCIKDTTPKKMPYTKEEAKVMLRKPSINDGFAEWRSWGVINMVMGCGVRAMTIVNMLKEDMDFANNTIYLRHSKDGGQNVITLVPQLKRAIVTYLKHNIFDTEFLFPSITGARMTVGLPPVFVPTSELVKTVSWHPHSFIGLATS